jgi:hypothetical protein
MRRWRLLAALALEAAACGGTAAPAPAASPPETALVLTIMYRDQTFDTLHLTGVTLATGRPFGPFEAHGSEVRPGATMALLFDPSDAGSAMVCVEGLVFNDTRAADCGMFPIVANQTSQGTLELSGGH